MTRCIDHGRDIRRETLRREVKMLHTRPIKSFEAVEMGVAKFENTMSTSEQTAHASELRKALACNSRDWGSFRVFRDMVTTQAAKVLMNRHKLPIHHVAGDAPEETEGDLATAGEFLAAFKNASSADNLLAAFHRFHGNGTNKGSGKGKDGEAGAARLRRCHNFGEEHANRVCTKPPVFFSDRKCFNCNASGNFSKDCPKRKAIKALTEALGAIGSDRSREIRMPHVGLSAKEVEEKYPICELANDLDIEDLIRLKDNKFCNMGMQVLQQILHHMAIAGRTRRAGPAIPEEASAQTPAATLAARSGRTAPPDVTAAVGHTTATTIPAASTTTITTTSAVAGSELRRFHCGARSSRNLP